ncbi:hypothetical protein L596_027039 [Steinernema carpocapsae]|uniref:Uncharacterized protein n=1 Tax=Steinernema carpocapsae TaxID=34508 RepID=A0A4U5M349_STECR|nr:hypothetical protein L596_027039 [Steinernema carpocapsae]
MDKSDLPSTSSASAQSVTDESNLASTCYKSSRPRSIYEPSFTCTHYQALQKAQELAARYSESGDVQLLEFLYGSQAFIQHSASVLNQKPRFLADLPYEIIREIVNQAEIRPDDLENVLKLKGPFSTMVKTRKVKMSVDITGAYPADTISDERVPVQISNYQPLHDTCIHSLQINLSDARSNLFEVQNSDRIIQTLRLALRGWIDNLFIQVPISSQQWHVDFINTVFQNSPSFISAKSIRVNLGNNKCNSPDLPDLLQVCRPLKEFLKRAVTQTREQGLIFTYNGETNNELGDAVASGFCQECIKQCEYSCFLNEAQVKTILDRKDVVSKYDQATIRFNINRDFEEGFPAFLRNHFRVEETAEHYYDNRSKIARTGYYIAILRRKNKVTVTVAKDKKGGN